MRNSSVTESCTTHKATPAILEKSLQKAMRILRSGDSQTIQEFLPGGTLADLVAFAERNTVAVGYLMYQILNTIIGRASSTNDGKTDVDYDPCDLQEYDVLEVAWEIAEYKALTKTFPTGPSVVRTGTHGTTQTQVHHIGHGAAFTLKVRWTFRGGTEARAPLVLNFEERITTAPESHKQTKLKIEAPAAEEFDIASLLRIVSDAPCTGVRLSPDATAATYPRHNKRVQAIEKALGAVRRLVDLHANFLGPLDPVAVSREVSKIEMPWSLCRETLPSADKEGMQLDALLARALEKFHENQFDLLAVGDSVRGLVQVLVLLKGYSAHFTSCYEAIDHVMVRAFLEGIGPHNATPIARGQPLDSLLMKIGKFQMERKGMPLKDAVLTTPGCSLCVQLKLPGTDHFQRLQGIGCVDKAFAGTLCFGGGGGIPTEGTSTRLLFLLSAESPPSAPPQLRVEGVSDFENVPVMAIIGTPDGTETKVKVATLLVNGKCLRYVLQLGFIPSNKAFADAVAVLPPEMADFASAIRECDVAESGLDLQLIDVRGPLADAIGIKESDLMGDPEWCAQLVNLMRGGASLQCLSQVPRTRPRPIGTEATEPAPYCLTMLKDRTKALWDRLRAEGKVDYATCAPAYHSCGLEDDDGPHVEFRGLCGAASHPNDPPSAGNVGGAVGDGDGGGDAAVASLTNEVGEMRTTTTDKNFMKRVMHALEALPDPKAVLGAKIELPAPLAHCTFAKCRFPDEVHSRVKLPPDASAYQCDDHLDSSTDTFLTLLRNCTAPIVTQRITLFGVGCVWTSDVLVALMTGARDPSKLQLDVALALAPLQVE